MSRNLRFRLFMFSFKVILFVITWGTLHFAINDLSIGIKSLIAGLIMFILSPQISSYETSSGTKNQLKWIFMKKVISF